MFCATHIRFRNTVLDNKNTPRSGQLNLSLVAATSAKLGLHAGNTELDIFRTKNELVFM